MICILNCTNCLRKFVVWNFRNKIQKKNMTRGQWMCKSSCPTSSLPSYVEIISVQNFRFVRPNGFALPIRGLNSPWKLLEAQRARMGTGQWAHHLASRSHAARLTRQRCAAARLLARTAHRRLASGLSEPGAAAGTAPCATIPRLLAGA